MASPAGGGGRRLGVLAVKRRENRGEDLAIISKKHWKTPMLAELITVANGNFHRKFFNGNFYEMCGVGDVPFRGKRATRADISIMSERGRHHTLINLSLSVSIKMRAAPDCVYVFVCEKKTKNYK